LEVSSPGLERVLRKPEHFEASIGSEIEIRLFAPDENKTKSYIGILSAYDEETLTIESDQVSHKVPMNKISKVRTVFDFSSINMKED
jgi:ribosome maturation factor RimP